MTLEAYTSDALALRRPLPEDALLIFGSGEREDRRLPPPQPVDEVAID